MALLANLITFKTLTKLLKNYATDVCAAEIFVTYLMFK
jgi:hypothetical protein